MGVDVTVREPTVADARALGRVHVRAWQAAYRGGLMPDEYLDGLEVGDRVRMWEEGLGRPTRPRSARLLAEDAEGTVTGFITVGPSDGNVDSEVGEVYALNVEPDAWGEGYGGVLLGAGTRALSGAGFGEAVLWVHPGNRRARRFYEHNGWRSSGQERLQEVLDVEVPELQYRRPLGG